MCSTHKNFTMMAEENYGPYIAKLQTFETMLDIIADDPERTAGDLTPKQLSDIRNLARRQMVLDQADACVNALDTIRDVGLDDYFVRQIVYHGLEVIKNAKQTHGRG